MLTQLHDHMAEEAQQGARTDTVFVVTAVIFNLIALVASWAVASPNGTEGHRTSNDAILAVLVLVTLAINAFAVRGLLSGKDRMQRLLAGLSAMYADAGVAKYYAPALMANYRSRYTAFLGMLGVLAGAAIAVPLLWRLLA